MKKINKVLSLALAFIMMLGVAMPAMASNVGDTSTATEAVTKTVTLHKLLMTKAELDAWDSADVENKGYDGTQALGTSQTPDSLSALVGKDLKEIAGVYFAWKVDGGDYVKANDAKNGPEVSEGKIVTTKNIDEAYGMLTESTGAVFNTADFPAGDYEIDEIRSKTTYVDGANLLADQKAVPVKISLPLVNEDGVVEEAHVYPKNTQEKPQIDKNFANPNDVTLSL